jgi:hypothetical protein
MKNKGRKKTQILEGSSIERKKKVEVEEANVNEAAPPPYTPATAEGVNKSFWKKRWFLAVAIGGLYFVDNCGRRFPRR